MTRSVQSIDKRRRHILEEMQGIRSLQRATLKEQMLAVAHKGKKEPVLRGPYYVLARWIDGKTQSRRVKADELEQVRADVANHKRFLALCREFEELTEELGALERSRAASEKAEKRGLKSRKKSRPK